MVRVPREIAQSGWVVEVVVTIADDRPESRFFAVGSRKAAEAEEAVLRFPGIVRQDRRIARRRLSAIELRHLALRAQGVRPYPSASEAWTGIETDSSALPAHACAVQVGAELMPKS